MAAPESTDKHIAELHSEAARLGVPGYRKLRRDKLVAEIAAHGGEAAERSTPELSEAETEPVIGVLDRTHRGYGFLRLQGLQPSAGDVYVSASQIRRCELRLGDQVSGPARAAERGERYPALVHVDLVNGEEPREEAIRSELEDLTAIPPTRRLWLEPDSADVLTRAVDLLVPLAFGQRVLVSAAPRSGRTTLLRGLVGAIQGSPEPPALIVLLVDERPEEATRWAELLPDDELAVAGADMRSREQAHVAELALARAKRRVEGGEDVVLVVDSLSRLAVAGADPTRVKKVFGAGRELAEEEAGSLTVIGTTLDGSDDEGAARAAVETTESATIRLDPELAAEGVYPALAFGECRAFGEEELREPDEVGKVRELRSRLDELEAADAAATLRERIEATAANDELLSSL